ncbi:MAG: replication initiator protein A [Oscillospiraceae bacterium]|nr:replication initiator protein A [Oscillospiraceae bacterium]MBR1458409.1 replication initiator protein A [Oscillospiraceae bacterium]
MFEYFYVDSVQDFRFMKLPVMLFTEPQFEGLSNDAKLLYSLLLDRTRLSLRNGWQDAEGHIYIHFKNAEIQQVLHVGAQKAVKTLRELEEVGLIRKKHIGLGKPDIIFVMQFIEPPADDENHHAGYSEPEIQERRMPKIETPAFPYAQVPQYNNQTYRVRRIQSDPSDADTMERYREQIKENIDYDWFAECYADKEKIGGSQEELDGIVEIITECACSTQPIRVHGQPMAAEVVKSRLMKIGSEHIQYVFDCLARVTTKIRNIKAYLITALYNAPTTIDSYYSTLVRHNLYCRE